MVAPTGAQSEKKCTATHIPICAAAQDDATGEARARLRVESARRRSEAEAERRRQNAEYFARLRKTKTLTDSKIWDDGEGTAGAMRSVVAARSRARKQEEKETLRSQNAALQRRLHEAGSRTDDGIDAHAAVNLH